MRLLVGDHLQAMLDASQIEIGFAQLGDDVRLDPSALGELRQGVERAPRAQLHLPSAGDELLRLHEELDLADAAAPELDVVAGDGDAPEAAMGENLPLHRVHVGDGRIVEILAPDERRQLVQQLLARGDVAGAGARLDERRALPVLPEALVVDERRRGRQGDLRGAGVRAQPQVGAEDVAVAGALRHHLHEVARQAHEEALRLDPRSGADQLALVKDDEVDVARIVELARAVLAHGEDDVASGRDAAVGRGHPLAARRRLAEQEVDGGIERRVGALGQRGGHREHRPHAGEIGERRQQRHLALELA